MTLPEKYDAVETQRVLDEHEDRLNVLKHYVALIPLDAAPLNPKDGWVAMSDGTGSGFDGASGAGLYRYLTSAWVFIG
jgi:hypothetical protein